MRSNEFGLAVYVRNDRLRWYDPARGKDLLTSEEVRRLADEAVARDQAQAARNDAATARDRVAAAREEAARAEARVAELEALLEERGHDLRPR